MSLYCVWVILLPLLAAALFAWLPRASAGLHRLSVGVPLACLGTVIYLGAQLGDAPLRVAGPEWAGLPQLGLEVTFLLDGLSIFFALLVTGIGSLIYVYTLHYFGAGNKKLNRFLACLSLFMAAMLGTVLAGNLLTLFVCWELTGLASFLLIGFKDEKEASRHGARMALITTMSTGLVMLCGMVLLSQLAGTSDILALSEMPLELGGPLATAALLLLAVGAFGKSAQVPFHFWLPNAMAAPTPVSAYLHSATMVKLGVFLVARLFPIFRDSSLWVPLLGGVGCVTMLWAAWLALRSTDLKAILAYSTICQLGFLVGFYGLGAYQGLRLDVFHIANHASYKACLFMVVGIIDLATGCRDIRQLGGLRRRMPWLAAICLVGCACMAGLPGTTGFISKELMLADLLGLLRTEGGVAVWCFAGLIVVASVIKVAFSARIVLHVLGGAETPVVVEHFKKPSLWIQLPPTILASGIVIFGLAPGLLDRGLNHLAGASLYGDAAQHLAIWHGLSPELAVSLCIMAAGAVLYVWHNRRGWADGIPRAADWGQDFEWAMKVLPRAGTWVARWSGAGKPRNFMPILVLTYVVIVGGYLLTESGRTLLLATVDGLSGSSVNHLRLATALILCVSAFAIVRMRVWTRQLIALSTVGLMSTFYFVLYRAPDLALTQILVETATLLGILLLLSRFPATADRSAHVIHGSRGRRLFKAVLAVSFGVLAAALVGIIQVLKQPDSLGAALLAASLPEGKGANAVNVILIDFRGFDTLGEITVLLVAVLGGIGLLMRKRRSAADWSAGEKGPAGFGVPRDAHATDEPGLSTDERTNP